MKRRKAVSPINVTRSRSLAWAARLTQRYARWSDFSRLSMLLYVPALARTLILLQQRQLTTLFKLHPQLNLSFNQRHTVTAWTSQVSAPQMTFVNLLTLANLATLATTNKSETPLSKSAPSVVEDLRKIRYVRDYDNHQRLALTLAINRTATDLATTVNRKFTVQREAQLRDVATLLTRRVKRISEPATATAPMAFRAPAATRASAGEPMVEVMRSREASLSRSFSPAMPSIAPPPLNVEVLADEVMKQIDRRVIARRERMGQF